MSYKDKLYELQPFKFYSLTVWEYFQHERKIHELLSKRGVSIFPETKTSYLFEAQPQYNTTRQDKDRILTGFTCDDYLHWYVCIIYTPTSCTYWFVKHSERPDFEYAFEEILYTIQAYNVDDLKELLPRLRDEYEIDLNLLDFEYEDWLMEKCADLRLSLLECFCNAGFKSNHSHKDTWTTDLSQEEFFQHLNEN